MIKLIEGDCAAALRTLPDASVDAVITDPPYGIGKAVWDNDVEQLHEATARECSRVLREEGICFWFSSIGKMPQTPHATRAIPYKWLFIWYASNNMRHGAIGFAMYTPCLVLSKGSVWRNMQDLRNGAIPGRPVDTLGHPTQKPLALMRYLVAKATREGDTVLDPFMGSGSTGVACVELGRGFIGVEIDSDYFTLAQERIERAWLQPSLPVDRWEQSALMGVPV